MSRRARRLRYLIRGRNYRRMAISSASAVAVFSAKDLRREFDEGRVKALRGAAFSINEGEFVAITGPSGCGKSTLLQLLGGLDRPTSGHLFYRGKPLSDWTDLSTYRSHEIGFIFQSFHLLPTFTASENVQIPMFETSRSLLERTTRANHLLELVGLKHRLNQYPVKLSGGERQRVAIARSLANGPAVLLADEPTGNLDSTNTHAILDLLVQLHQDKGRTMVMATHDPAVAARASRILFMKDGLVEIDERPFPEVAK